MRRLSFLIFFVFLLQGGCASKVLDYKNTEKLENNEEFSKLVKIKEIPGQTTEEAAEEVESVEPVEADEKKSVPEPSKESEKKKSVKKAPKPKPTPKPEAKQEAKKVEEKNSKQASKKTMKHLPEIEDGEGYNGRRPLVDPFRVGEAVTLSMTYFNITAGDMILKVNPFVEVNGRKAYTFAVDLKTNSIFSRFYSVNDKASTHVDYETLLPYDHQISVKESKQLREIKSFFDFENNKASYWETKVSDDKGEESKKLEWNILPYSQNVVSAAFYLRTMALKPGKKVAFRVAEEGKNIVFTGEVLRRENLKTDLGTLKTVVVKPEIEVDGVFKPMGDLLIWLTDDDRKFIVRIEAKIKIGTIIAKLKKIKEN